MQLEQLQAQRNVDTSLKQSSSIPPYSGPPCCGTGCAVCVLDYWEPSELDTPAPETSADDSDHGHERRACNITNELAQSAPPPGIPADLSADLPANLPDCCGTGCAVCVLDYPDNFSKQRSESETLAMLEAIEQAQWRARQMIANQDGDSL